MSNSSDTPWTEEEKNTLLSEILKKAGIPSNYLLRIINEFRISPDWEHIPLPQGRSLSQCRLAFENMQLQLKSQTQSQAQAQPQSQSQSPFQPQPQQPQAQHQHQYQQPPHPAPPPTAVPIPRPEAPGTPSSIDANLRKRPLYPAEKPLAPRAIQPRPPASTASYSSESSAQLSPRLDTTSTGEPPRKRGRPSKAETERRKAAAEARGETYPPPRRANPNRMRIPPSPTSPAGPYPVPTAPGPASHPVHGPNAGLIPYDVPGPRPLAPAPSIPGASSSPSSNPNPSERRDIPNRSMGPNMRELPRPTEMGHPGHPLPSPHALQLGTLQLGPPDPFPRLNSNPGERSAYGAIPPDRFSPPDSGRRDSVASRGEREREREREREGMGSYVEARSSTTPGEKALR
ncbi:uncharacterized protein N7496_010477 [Penicillium cataractarum]|uniref:Myb-like domain-containing protein n=1 Tax=Penicillium cataractarum TaxID=2100454 RepID=A0A9W9V1Z5_9EURO|nr:uncharacterized protein N7496_010477 [Penicillium cataractarum]KAJ5364764.1 hypothetical protein N7496_010477 [Penicillium cataractarum]